MDETIEPMSDTESEVNSTRTPVGEPTVAAAPLAEPDLMTSDHLRSTRRRRRWLPIFLFLATCLSTFWVGVMDWQPVFPMFSEPMHFFRVAIISRWEQGFAYMGAVIAILLAHEMGHFVATLVHRIPASFPYFIPLPPSPIGTMGAVIGMAGHKADRREMFDIGIAGPLAGLVVAVPILWLGILRLDMSTPGYGPMDLDCPLLVRWLIGVLRPDLGEVTRIPISQVNSLFMAAWVGLFVTGLNMLPISQLDGGHVIYALFLRRGHYLARGFLIFVILYIVFANAVMWIVMLVLVVLIGTDHPPTANDRIPLGRFRTILGATSLVIPVICFPPHGFFF